MLQLLSTRIDERRWWCVKSQWFKKRKSENVSIMERFGKKWIIFTDLYEMIEEGLFQIGKKKIGENEDE